MSSFQHAFVSVVVNNIAWLNITLQIIALSHCCLGLVHNVGPPLSKKLLSTEAMFLCWIKGDCMLQGVWMSVFGESPWVCVAECNKSICSVRFFLFSATVCLMLIQTAGEQFINPTYGESNQICLDFNIFPTDFFLLYCPHWLFLPLYVVTQLDIICICLQKWWKPLPIVEHELKFPYSSYEDKDKFCGKVQRVMSFNKKIVQHCWLTAAAHLQDLNPIKR